MKNSGYEHPSGSNTSPVPVMNGSNMLKGVSSTNVLNDNYESNMVNSSSLGFDDESYLQNILLSQFTDDDDDFDTEVKQLLTAKQYTNKTDNFLENDVNEMKFNSDFDFSISSYWFQQQHTNYQGGGPMENSDMPRITQGTSQAKSQKKNSSQSSIKNSYSDKGKRAKSKKYKQNLDTGEIVETLIKQDSKTTDPSSITVAARGDQDKEKGFGYIKSSTVSENERNSLMDKSHNYNGVDLDTNLVNSGKSADFTTGNDNWSCGSNSIDKVKYEFQSSSERQTFPTACQKSLSYEEKLDETNSMKYSSKEEVIGHYSDDDNYNSNYDSNDSDDGNKKDKRRRKCPKLSQSRMAAKAKNREHAKNTRIRKKNFIESLKQKINSIDEECSKADKDRKDELRRLADQMALRKGILKTFLDYRSTGELSEEKWQTILEPDFKFVLPITPYRSYPPHEVMQGQRHLRGIQSLIQDTASHHTMIQSMAPRYNPDDKIKIQFHSDQDHSVMTNNVYFCKWHMFTTNAVSRGSRYEVQKSGFIKTVFTDYNKLDYLEFIFDTMSFMQQFKRACGSMDYILIPNTIPLAIDFSHDIRIITESKEPYRITFANKNFLETFEYASADILGQKFSLLYGEETDVEYSNFLNRDLENVCYPRCTELNLYSKTTVAICTGMKVYPLYTYGQAKHYLRVFSTYDFDVGRSAVSKTNVPRVESISNSYRSNNINNIAENPHIIQNNTSIVRQQQAQSPPNFNLHGQTILSKPVGENSTSDKSGTITRTSFDTSNGSDDKRNLNCNNIQAGSNSSGLVKGGSQSNNELQTIISAEKVHGDLFSSNENSGIYSM